MSDGPGRVGVVSVGMMPFSRVLPENTGEMVYRVTKDALEGAGLRADDVDAVVLGSAVDPFNGINESDKFAVAAATGRGAEAVNAVRAAHAGRWRAL